MPLVLSSIISLLAGLGVVAITSPTIRNVYQNHDLSILSIHALVADAMFVLLLALLSLCRLEPRYIARKSFPYGSQAERTVGRRGFEFQLLVFEIFHQQTASQVVHAINIISQGLLWTCIIRTTFGLAGTIIVLLILAGQSISYGDDYLATAIVCLQLIYIAATELTLFLASLDRIPVLNVAKAAILWLSLVQTVNHAFEPLPPTFDTSTQQFDDGFGGAAWKQCFLAPFTTAAMMVLGLVSEIEAGCPGRFLNQIIFKIIWKAGYRSETLLSVADAKEYGRAVISNGWMAHPTTAALYKWAAKNKVEESTETALE